MKRIAFLAAAAFAMLLTSCSGRSQAATSNVEDSDSITVVEDASAGSAAADDATVTFAFGGDVMMGTTYPENYLPPNEGNNLFDDVKGLLQAADIAAVNLEGTLLDAAGTPKKCSNPSICYAFKMPTKYVRHLTDAGIDFVSVANNHCNDFGPEGLSSTRATLDKAGIKYSGTKGVCETAYLERNGLKIGMAAFGFSKGTLSIKELDYMKKVIGELDKNADLVVVSMHNGAEGKGATHVTHASETAFGEDRGNPEKFARAAIDAGADIVWGHGPHVVRGLDIYKDRLIIYSLGNFVSPYRMSLSGISGHAPVVTVTIDKEGKFQEGAIHSFIQQTGVGPRKDAGNAAARQMARLTKEDFPDSKLEIDADGKITCPNR